jgi:hypothetical protein
LELTPYEIALIGVGSAIVGALLTAWLGYRFAIDISKREFANAMKIADLAAIETQRRDDLLLVRQAAAKFRGVFAAGTEWNAQWQATFFPNQATAIEEFRVFIEPERLEAYNKAWDEYHRPQRTNGNIRFEEYYVGDELKCRNNFKTKIEAVLEFAKE